MVIETPVKRALVFSSFDAAIFHALGADEAIVGVVDPVENWHVDYMKQGFADGRIQYVGQYNALDYELIKVLKPDMVLTGDPSIVPMMDELGIPVVVALTTTGGLAARINFVRFISHFFNKEAEGEIFYTRVNAALDDIQEKTRGRPKPKTMWGYVYEKRAMVSPGNSWAAELMSLAQSDYLFDDVPGSFITEISLERFIHSGSEADIFFDLRYDRAGVDSKASMIRITPLLSRLKPLGPEGRVYMPLPHYYQSADRLDEILTEIAAILHPDAYPAHQLQFFLQLPDDGPPKTAQN
jgi:iron complex transport system substrate-binding protein